jgi:hypothetical protein
MIHKFYLVFNHPIEHMITSKHLIFCKYIKNRLKFNLYRPSIVKYFNLSYLLILVQEVM